MLIVIVCGKHVIEGVSKIRNPVIARVFRELKLIEQWGSGVPRIFRETAAAGFPEPYLVELGLRVRFIFPLAEMIKTAEVPHRESGARVTAQVGPESRPESRPESWPESRLEAQLGSQLAVKLVLLLAQGAAGKAELAQNIGHKTVSGELKKQIRRLLDLGLIGMAIPEKPNSRLQKYRLTEKGKKALDAGV